MMSNVIFVQYMFVTNYDISDTYDSSPACILMYKWIQGSHFVQTVAGERNIHTKNCALENVFPLYDHRFSADKECSWITFLYLINIEIHLNIVVFHGI